VAIRPAAAPDVPAIEAIVRDAYTKYIERIGKRPGPMLDDYPRLVEDGGVWVLSIGEEVRGVLVLVAESDHLLLDNVAVDPRHQREGHGRALIGFAEQEARRRGYREIRLYTNLQMHENIAMYSRMGFEELGRSERSGYHRIHYRKLLDED
jgi:ribosomal protein S18 acetylase RimI-like enzyme